MGKTLYVGNLPYKTTPAALRHLFARHGAVYSVDFVRDPDTDEFLGFGFVGMAVEGAVSAVSGLDGAEFDGRRLHVVTTGLLDLWSRRAAGTSGT